MCSLYASTPRLGSVAPLVHGTSPLLGDGSRGRAALFHVNRFYKMVFSGHCGLSTACSNVSIDGRNVPDDYIKEFSRCRISLTCMHIRLIW